MTRPAPHVVGIAGPSGAGKTALTRALAARLTGGAVVLPLDAYYRDPPSGDPAAATDVNFDHPDAIDLPLLVSNLDALLRGAVVERPVYDFAGHRRQVETVRLAPGAFVLVEGLLTFHWKTVRERCGTRIFLDAEDEIRLQRRIARDTRERGRTEASVRLQWSSTVLPMTRRYVRPTRGYAHAVVDAARPPEELATLLTRRFGW